MYNFRRPEGAAYPQVYYRFKAKDKNSENIIYYRVQDLPEEMFEKAAKFMVEKFLPFETICMSVKAHLNPVFCDQIFDFWMKQLEEKLSIACFKDDGSKDFVAINVMVVKSQSDAKDDAVDAVSWRAEMFTTDCNWHVTTLQNQDQTLTDVLGVLDFCAKQFDVCKHFSVDRYLTAYGLCVDLEYRGRGIATEMLKARVPFMQTYGLQVTANSFTGIGSQVAAKKAGYQDSYVIDYSELGRLFPRFDFSKSATKSFKTMTLPAWRAFSRQRD